MYLTVCRMLDMLQNLTTNVEVDSAVSEWSYSSRNIAVMVLRQVQLSASRVHCSLARNGRRQELTVPTSRQFECSRLGNSSENRHMWNEVGNCCYNLTISLFFLLLHL